MGLLTEVSNFLALSSVQRCPCNWIPKWFGPGVPLQFDWVSKLDLHYSNGMGYYSWVLTWAIIAGFNLGLLYNWAILVVGFTF